MNTLTIRLPDDIATRLKNTAKARGVSVNKLMTEISLQALTALDAETHFNAARRTANIPDALALLDRLDGE